MVKPTSVKRGFQFQWWYALAGLGLLALIVLALLVGPGLRRQLVPSLSTPSAVPPATIVPTQINATLVPLTPVASGDPQQVLDEATASFKAGDIALGQSQLELAVSMAPNDPTLLLHAGDIALTNQLALYALEHFYFPALPLTRPQDALSAEVRAHTALAAYVAAADPRAKSVFEAQLQINPDADMAAVALARSKIFSGDLPAASTDLTTLADRQPDNPAILLITGDWYLAQGQLDEAQQHYEQVREAGPGQNQPAPPWMRREADCKLHQIQDLGQTIKLEPTCEDLPSLVIGR